MYKKTAASVLTFALVLSLFAGLSFAADTYKIMLSTSSITAYSATSFYTVTGSVLKNGAYDGRDYRIVLDYDGGMLQTKVYEAKRGEINFYLPSDLAAQSITVKAYLYTSGESPGGTVSIGSVAEAEIKVLYNVSVNPGNLQFAHGQSGPGDVITGTVTDGQNRPVEGARVELYPVLNGVRWSHNYAPAGLKTSSSGGFGFVVANWQHVGDLELVIDGVVHKTGKVSGKQAKLTVSPAANVPHSIAETRFSVLGSSFGTNSRVDLVIKDSAGNSIAGTSGYAHADSSGNFTYEFPWLATKAGTYTLEAVQGVYFGSATIQVVNPSGYNFVNSEQLTALRIGDASRNQLRVGKPNGAYLVTWDGNQLQDNFYYDVYVDGELKVEKQSIAAFGVDVNSFSAKSIRLVAFKASGGSYTHVTERTFAAKVSGWNVSVNAGSLTVNETRDLIFTVKDESGVPMNNATIKFAGYELNPYNYNAQNGTYVFKDVRFTNAGSVSVLFNQGSTEKAQMTLSVVGQKVYNLSSNTGTVLLGQSQTVRFNVSKNNLAQMPQAMEMEDSKGKISVLSFNVISTSGSSAVVDVTIKPEVLGDVTIRARNFNGSECGELKLSVIGPKLVVLGEEVTKVTENFRTSLRFKLVDPRDSSIMLSDIAFSADYADIAVYGLYDSPLWNNILMGANEHEIKVLATDAKYDAATEGKGNVQVTLKVGDVVVATLPIAKATLESDPNIIVIGTSTPLKLSYKDANGLPLADKLVEVQEGNSYSNVGRTDSSGQVVYPVVAAYGNSVVFRAATDVSKQYVSGEVRYGYDTEDPKIAYSKEVNTSTTTITITDNVRLTRVRINGKDIDIFPTKRHDERVELKLGKNEFLIEAQDDNYNAIRETITITYAKEGTVTPPTGTGESVKYTIGKATYYVDGVARQLEAAPFLRGDHTLIPVRALEAIGAKLAWNDTTKTATFQLDGNVVKVTIGKSTAIVNDAAQAMPVAAEIVNGRTMVPFRFVGQSLGLKVDYIDATKDIIITRNE